MKKHHYRAQSITALKPRTLQHLILQPRLIVGIDVAKTDFVAALITPDQQVQALVKWQHPSETTRFYQLITDTLRNTSVELAMEPSGTYGDPIRQWFNQHDYPVFRVSPKRSHDAAEVFDGVPSLHDPKSATIIAQLHLQGISEPWPNTDPQQRALRAAINTMALYDDLFYRHCNRLESQLARHWPELTFDLDITSVTLLELLSHFGCPDHVARHPQQAHSLMRRVGRTYLTEEKIDHVIHSAAQTLGMPCIDDERRYLQNLAQETRLAQKNAKSAKRAVINAGILHPPIRAIAPVVGPSTAVVLYTLLGPPDHYPCAASYLKAMGLNLKQRSSGKHIGRLMITKRGSGTVRRYLYFAALRLVKSDPVVQQWYQHKILRDGGKLKMKALVAVMRKLARALWHVARGQPFDASQLFDLNHLQRG